MNRSRMALALSVALLLWLAIPGTGRADSGSRIEAGDSHQVVFFSRGTIDDYHETS